MAVEARAVELRQDEDAVDPGVQAVADRDVDQPELPPERDRGLRAMPGQRPQARPRAARDEDRLQPFTHLDEMLLRLIERSRQ